MWLAYADLQVRQVEAVRLRLDRIRHVVEQNLCRALFRSNGSPHFERPGGVRQ
jgi:hypothetical protein